MNKRIDWLGITFPLVVSILFSSCAPRMVTKGAEFPLIYEEAPVTILILPPINESTAADAKEYYATTIQEPLSLSGYYVFPYEITTEILKMEGLYDAELLLSIPLSKFREYFGADAVLFTTITKWDLAYIVLASTLTVSVDCALKSTKSDQILWKYNGTVVIDLSGGNINNKITNLIAQLIVTAVSSAVADYVPYARMANYRAIASIPFGKYHPQYMKDREQKIIDQTPEKSN